MITRNHRVITVLKTVLFGIAGVAFLLLGLVGLVLPILPGFLFLFAAAACFAFASPRAKQSFGKHPRMSRFLNRVDAGTHLDLTSRIKLAFWASLEAINPQRRTPWHNRRMHQ